MAVFELKRSCLIFNIVSLFALLVSQVGLIVYEYMAGNFIAGPIKHAPNNWTDVFLGKNVIYVLLYERSGLFVDINVGFSIHKKCKRTWNN